MVSATQHRKPGCIYNITSWLSSVLRPPISVLFWRGGGGGGGDFNQHRFAPLALPSAESPRSCSLAMVTFEFVIEIPTAWRRRHGADHWLIPLICAGNSEGKPDLDTWEPHCPASALDLNNRGEVHSGPLRCEPCAKPEPTAVPPRPLWGNGRLCSYSTQSGSEHGSRRQEQESNEEPHAGVLGQC